MQDRRYREMGGVLQHVLDSIHLARELGLWVEVVTLVIPGFNDSVKNVGSEPFSGFYSASSLARHCVPSRL